MNASLLSMSSQASCFRLFADIGVTTRIENQLLELSTSSRPRLNTCYHRIIIHCLLLQLPCPLSSQLDRQVAFLAVLVQPSFRTHNISSRHNMSSSSIVKALERYTRSISPSQSIRITRF